MKLSQLKELIKTSMLEVAPKESDKMPPKGDSNKLSPKDRKTLDDYEKENRGQLRTPSVVHGGITMREGYDIPDDIEWQVDDVVGDIDGYTVELALRGYSPSTGKYYTAGTDGVDAGGGDYDYSTTDLYGIEEVPDNTSMTEESSKAAAILNRPSNRMTFEQMGMIMMLADEVGGEENAKANEFLSGVASKMEADKYIQELIAKIDGEEDVLAEAEKIVAAWAQKQTAK